MSDAEPTAPKSPNPDGPAPDDKAAPRRRPRRLATVLAWGTTAALVACAGVLIALSAGHEPTSPESVPPKLESVETLRVEPREHVEALTLPARLEADRRAAIGTELAGRIESWLVEDGATVSEGQVVAVLDGSDLEARIAELTAQRESGSRSAEVSGAQLEVVRVALRLAERASVTLGLELESALAEKEYREKEHQRLSSLATSAAVSQSELDAAVRQQTQARIAVEKVRDSSERSLLAVESARAQVAHAESLFAQAKARVDEIDRGIDTVRLTLEKTRLRSAISGRLEERLFEPGEVVRPGDTLARVFDLSHVRAVVDVPDRYVPFLDADHPMARAFIERALPGAQPRLRAEIVIPRPSRLTGPREDGVRIEAAIARIAQASDPGSNTFAVELRCPNPGGALKEGMIVVGRIEYLVRPEAILIPIRAVQVTDAGPRVLVVETAGGKTRARARDIEPLSIDGTRVLVGSGLSKGDELVVAGGKGVLDGEEVRVVVADGVVQPDRRERVESRR